MSLRMYISKDDSEGPSKEVTFALICEWEKKPYAKTKGNLFQPKERVWCL